MMKALECNRLAVLLFLPLVALAAPPPGYRLVLSDDFSGGALDTSKWSYRTDVKRESSQRSENVSIQDGNLVIALKKESHRGKQFTAGGVVTRGLFRYGYFEARAKMHRGSGWHQSVWAMFGDGATTYPSRMRTEIDAMEYDSDLPAKGHMGLIKWYGPGRNRSWTCTPGVYRGPLGFDATADYHLYGFEWTEKEVRYFLDDDLRCVLPYPAEEFEHDRIALWLTAIAYQSVGGAIDETVLPGRMLVDFARIYAKEIYGNAGESGYSEQGVWTTYPGAGYSFSDVRQTCTAGAAAEWRPPVPVDGEYEVFLHKTNIPESFGEADVAASAGGADLSRQLSFARGSSGWISLGRLRAAPATGLSIRLTRTAGCISAGMVKLVPAKND